MATDFADGVFIRHYYRIDAVHNDLYEAMQALSGEYSGRISLNVQALGAALLLRTFILDSSELYDGDGELPLEFSDVLASLTGALATLGGDAGAKGVGFMSWIRTRFPPHYSPVLADIAIMILAVVVSKDKCDGLLHTDDTKSTQRKGSIIASDVTGLKHGCWRAMVASTLAVQTELSRPLLIFARREGVGVDETDERNQ